METTSLEFSSADAFNINGFYLCIEFKYINNINIICIYLYI